MSFYRIPEQMPRRETPKWQAFGRFMLRILGWKLEGELPKEKKLLLALAPHTSNWDFIVGVSFILALDLKVSFLMKREAFFWPFKGFFMNLGAVPIDRKQAKDVVTQAVDWYGSHDKVWLGITPEGTRSRVDRWKTGFLRMAHAADVPVLLIGMDATRKTIILDKVIRVSEQSIQQPEVHAEEIRQYMTDKFIGIRPENH